MRITKIGEPDTILHEAGRTIKACAENAVTIGAKLIGAELNGAELNGAELNRAELNGAELNRAELIGAKLIGAKLNGAELNGAELNRAKLIGAELNGTSFVAADMRYCDRNDDAKIARMDVCEWPVTIQFDGVHIGCKTFSIEDILGMTEEIAGTHHERAPVRWRRWGKAVQALAIATLGGPTATSQKEEP